MSSCHHNCPMNHLLVMHPNIYNGNIALQEIEFFKLCQSLMLLSPCRDPEEPTPILEVSQLMDFMIKFTTTNPTTDLIEEATNCSQPIAMQPRG